MSAMRCESKVIYDDLNLASEAAVRQLEDYRRRQRPYQCEVCGRFHLTSQPISGLSGISAEYIRRVAEMSARTEANKEKTENLVEYQTRLTLENAQLRERLHVLRGEQRALRSKRTRGRG